MSVGGIARGKGLDTHPELFVTLGLRGPSAPCPSTQTQTRDTLVFSSRFQVCHGCFFMRGFCRSVINFQKRINICLILMALLSYFIIFIEL